MDKMREEFETWVKSTFNIDCSEMLFGIKGGDEKERYYDDDDADGAIIVSAMFYAWKASRAALCVNISDAYCKTGMLEELRVQKAMFDAGVSYK